MILHQNVDPFALSPDELGLPFKAPKVEVISDDWSEEYQPCSFNSSIVSGSIPELGGVPLLDDDVQDISVPKRHAPKKYRPLSKIKFVNCSADHPLSTHCKGDPTMKIGNKPRLRHALNSRYHNKSTRIPPEKLQERGTDPNSDPNSEPPTTVEMDTYETDHKLLFRVSQQRFPRANGDFLRMYIAQRDMVLNNKLNGLHCRPLLPPRNDTAANSPTESALGIAYKWTPRRTTRQWRALSAADAKAML